MKKFYLLTSVLLTACIELPPSTDYGSLSKHLVVGMTKQEVISILGMPKYKKIDGMLEIYNYNSSGMYQKSSYLHAYFDENGKLESFESN